MRRILVPLDGTEQAETALPLARLLARRAGADLLLAHVFEPPLSAGDLAGGSLGASVIAMPDERTTHELRRVRQDYLDDVVARTRAAMRVPAPDRRTGDARATPSPGAAAAGGTGDVVASDTDRAVRGVLLDGAPSVAIHDAALRDGADLVVMASHGRSGIARLVLGSVTEDLLRAGGVPVLVVPHGDMPDEPAFGGATPAPAHEAPLPRHLLVALDGSPESEAILEPATALARLLDSAVTLVTVRDVGRPDRTTLLPTSILDTTASDGRAGASVPATAQADPSAGGQSTSTDEAAYLAEVARGLAIEGCRVSTRVLEGHPVVDRLLACAEELGADWYALATQGHGLWTRLVKGSVAETLMTRAAVPVLLLHAQQPSHAEPEHGTG